MYKQDCIYCWFIFVAVPAGQRSSAMAECSNHPDINHEVSHTESKCVYMASKSRHTTLDLGYRWMSFLQMAYTL